MTYIIFDLEWNNAYNYKIQKGMNEIIEIGAVKLNNNLEIVDTFKQLIRPRISKKLGSRFKNLTNITMAEINEFGIDFDDAFSDFARWSQGENTVFLSWSQSDLYTLIDNFVKFRGTTYIDFIKYYADVQQYCMQFIDNNNGNQISLSRCAELFEIDLSDKSLHRALEDCFAEAYCFKKVFDREKFSKYISTCDKAFFERLVYKPYHLSPKDDIFDIKTVDFECPLCSGNVIPLWEYDYGNKAFKSAGQCNKCGKKFWIFVRAKKTYDDIVLSKRLVQINKKRARHIN
ncbi:MAG: exonuclease domain-containing protein [Eubacterium sp.]|nr:exonuclease domain-containing protein [Eubacterium sp.]